MSSVVVTLPLNPFLSIALVFVSLVIVIRIVRWLLDILP